MKELTLVLDDDEIYEALETEAKTTGCSVQDAAMEVLRQWWEDSELNVAERAELAEARREWQEEGGVDAHDFFDTLRKEEKHVKG